MWRRVNLWSCFHHIANVGLTDVVVSPAMDQTSVQAPEEHECSWLLSGGYNTSMFLFTFNAMDKLSFLCSLKCNNWFILLHWLGGCPTSLIPLALPRLVIWECTERRTISCTLSFPSLFWPARENRSTLHLLKDLNSVMLRKYGTPEEDWGGTKDRSS